MTVVCVGDVTVVVDGRLVGMCTGVAVKGVTVTTTAVGIEAIDVGSPGPVVLVVVVAVTAVFLWQRPETLVLTGQSTTKHAMPWVKASQSLLRPEVRSPHSLVMSEMTMSGTAARSDTMAPVSMSLKMCAAPVTAA